MGVIVTSIDHEKLASAFNALGMEKESGRILSRIAKRFGGGYAQQAAKRVVKPDMMSKLKNIGMLGLAGGGLYTLDKSLPGGLTGDSDSQPGASAASTSKGSDASPFSAQEREQFARFGMDPDRLRFMQSLSGLRQGMNLEKKLFEQAMSGSLPASVLGGGGGKEPEEDLEAYA